MDNRRLLLERICKLAPPQAQHMRIDKIGRGPIDMSVPIRPNPRLFMQQYKPMSGVWYSTMIDDDWSWMSWCLDNMTDKWLDFKTHTFSALSICPTSYVNMNADIESRQGKILKIDNPEDFIKFHEIFECRVEIPKFRTVDGKLTAVPYSILIDWGEVYKWGWGGIEITPYQEKFRMVQPYDWYK